MNIIVLVVDTLRYDCIAANGRREIHTPNLDRLASMSWVFDRAFSGSFPTIPHRTDALTARYGGPFHPWKPLDLDRPTIPTFLARHGYCTQLIHDTPHLVNGAHGFDYPFHAWTFVRGAEVDRAWLTEDLSPFDNWRFDPLFGPPPEDPVGTMLEYNANRGYIATNRNRRKERDWNVARLFLTVSDFLRDNRTRDNFFLWVDCFDPHEPWDSPPEFVKMYDKTPGYDGMIDPRTFGGLRNSPDLSPEALARIRATYLAKVSLVDKWFGKMLDTLEDTGLMEHTAVILTADHGTNLDGDRGNHHFGKAGPPLQWEAHVPFMVCAPGAGSGRSSAIVQPQDLFATVAEAAGVDDAMPDGTESFGLLATARSRRAPRAIALAGGSVDSWRRHKGQGLLFSVFDRDWNLGFAADTAQCNLFRIGSTTDVATEYTEVVERLHAAGRAEIARRGLDPALVAWLESGGQDEFPATYSASDTAPPPANWRPYFGNLYTGR